MTFEDAEIAIQRGMRQITEIELAKLYAAVEPLIEHAKRTHEGQIALSKYDALRPKRIAP